MKVLYIAVKVDKKLKKRLRKIRKDLKRQMKMKLQNPNAIEADWDFEMYEEQNRERVSLSNLPESQEYDSLG